MRMRVSDGDLFSELWTCGIISNRRKTTAHAHAPMPTLVIYAHANLRIAGYYVRGCIYLVYAFVEINKRSAVARFSTLMLNRRFGAESSRSTYILFVFI